MKKYILIVAGGKGLRMGGDLPKQFIPMNGKPILMHTLEAFHKWDVSAGLILVLPEDHQPYWNMLCKEIGCEVPHLIANGGATRFHSVLNGLLLLQKEIGNNPDCQKDIIVGIHDGVRPFVAPEVITACFTEANRCKAAIPTVPMIDSLRETDETGSHPVDRNRYMAVQTPQVFEYNLLIQAYGQPYNEQFTDDASVVEATGHAIMTVPGNRENIKITTPFDLLVAKALFEHRT